MPTPQPDAGVTAVGLLPLPADFLALPVAQPELSGLTPHEAQVPAAFTPVQRAVRPTPPISGGTLAASPDGLVVVNDPDRDLIYVVDVAANRVDTLELSAGDEPGRAAIHGAHAFVALRAGGALLTVDLPRRRVSARVAVCAAPRGVSFDGVEMRVLVACAGGQLVAVSADGARVLSSTYVAPDLRDVGRDARGIWVSQYRSARLLRLDAQLQQVDQQRPADVQVSTSSSQLRSFAPTLAWRTVAGPGGEPFMLHQRSQSSSVGAVKSVATETVGFGWAGPATVQAPVSPVQAVGSPYGVSAAPTGQTNADSGFCEGAIVHTTISRFGAAQVAAQVALPQAVVPVDLSLAPGGQLAAAVAPGNFVRQDVRGANSPAPQQLYLMAPAQLARSAGGSAQQLQLTDCLSTAQGWQLRFPGETTAVQFVDDRTLLVQVRDPAELDVVRFEQDGSARLTQVIALSQIALRDTGHEVFHQNTGTGIACASCHGEALDDGHVWMFADLGPRRTQHLRGGVLQTAPFHWSGDLADFDALINDVYQTRMGAAELAPDARAALTHWLGSLARVPSEPGDVARAARGRALFESADVGCASCHAGESLRSDGRFDVGTGGSFEVPSLRGLSLRLPLMHSGCADTLEQRFDPACGGANHGATAQLSEAQLGDLIAYLASL